MVMAIDVKINIVCLQVWIWINVWVQVIYIANNSLKLGFSWREIILLFLFLSFLFLFCTFIIIGISFLKSKVPQELGEAALWSPWYFHAAQRSSLYDDQPQTSILQLSLLRLYLHPITHKYIGLKMHRKRPSRAHNLLLLSLFIYIENKMLLVIVILKK